MSNQRIPALKQHLVDSSSEEQTYQLTDPYKQFTFLTPLSLIDALEKYTHLS